MIALDTNVLVRFLVRDDEAQTQAAASAIARAEARHERLFVSEVVMCELVWVLSFSYKVPKGEIVMLLGRLLHARQLTFRAPETLRRALDSYARGKGDFADYIIAEDAKSAGCASVLTFDQALLQEAGFAKP